MAKKRKDDTPPGGWLGPPPTQGLTPLAVQRSNGKWKTVEQTRKDKETRKEWERRMAKADKKDKWRFKWPPKE